MFYEVNEAWFRSGGRGGGGVLTLIHHDVNYTTLNTDHFFPGDSTIEHQGFTITVDAAKLNVINIYLPPTSCCPIKYPPTLQHHVASHDKVAII